MSPAEQHFDESYAGGAPANYERYFVPAIGAPVARDLIDSAELEPGERVLDVACGTGVLARMAAERVGPEGSVAGLDVNPGMLQVAREIMPSGVDVAWYQTSAEAMPLPDEAFDVVLCQMGLQFFSDKLAAVREMNRVLAQGGRLVLNLPGPTPEPFALMEAAFRRFISPEAGAFVRVVFSMHDQREIRDLIGAAGFGHVDVRSADKELRLPPARAFLWQYVHSTPLAGLVGQLDDERRGELERDVAEMWQPFAAGDGTAVTVRMVTVTALK